MLTYLIRRLLWALFLFLVVTIVTYVIFYVTPSDPARLAAGQGAPPDQGQKVARPLHLLDRTAMTFVLVGIAAHPVWIGLIFAYVFGFRLGLTPINGYCDFINPSLAAECGGPVQWAYHMILPWTPFMILFAALYTRLVRAHVLETMKEDFV